MGTSEEEEEEEYLIHVEFDSLLESETFKEPNLFFKVIGIDSEKPIMQIGDQVFTGTYYDIPGTSLFFEEDDNRVDDDAVFARSAERTLRYKYKTRKSLVMKRVFIKKKDLNSRSNEDTLEEEMMDADEMSDIEQLELLSSEVSSETVIGSELEMEISGDKGETELPHSLGVSYETRLEADQIDDEMQSASKATGGNIEPVAGPSWAPDIPPADCRKVLKSTVNADEMSRLIAEQMTLESDINLQNSTQKSNK